MQQAAIRQRGFVIKLSRSLMREAAGHYRWLQDPRVVRRMNWLVLAIILAKLSGENFMRGIADWVKLRKEQLAEGLGLAKA